MERSGWTEDEVRPLGRGPLKSIIAHVSTSGGGTWSFVDCGGSYRATKIRVKSWVQAEDDGALR
jgi:hypothetical protein